jgi:hypothetical protein
VKAAKKILHAAIHNAQLDHGFEFLGDRALHTVAANNRRRQVKERRIDF